jgi:hypothetical protein
MDPSGLSTIQGTPTATISTSGSAMVSMTTLATVTTQQSSGQPTSSAYLGAIAGVAVGMALGAALAAMFPVIGGILAAIAVAAALGAVGYWLTQQPADRFNDQQYVSMGPFSALATMAGLEYLVAAMGATEEGELVPLLLLEAPLVPALGPLAVMAVLFTAVAVAVAAFALTYSMLNDLYPPQPATSAA